MEYNDENLLALYNQDFSYKEIAARLGVSRSKIAGRIYRLKHDPSVKLKKRVPRVHPLGNKAYLRHCFCRNQIEWAAPKQVEINKGRHRFNSESSAAANQARRDKWEQRYDAALPKMIYKKSTIQELLRQLQESKQLA